MCSETVQADALQSTFVTCDLNEKAVYQSPHYSCESRLTFVVCMGIQYKAKLLGNNTVGKQHGKRLEFTRQAFGQIPQDAYIPDQTQTRAIPELVAVS